MSTREEVAAAHRAHMVAFMERYQLMPWSHHPDHRDRYAALLAAEEAACAEYERLAAEEEPQDPQPPTPDLRSDEDRAIDAAIAEEVALERGAFDSDWRLGGTRDD